MKQFNTYIFLKTLNSRQVWNKHHRYFTLVFIGGGFHIIGLGAITWYRKYWCTFPHICFTNICTSRNYILFSFGSYSFCFV